jgi:hypothetical protein
MAPFFVTGRFPAPSNWLINCLHSALMPGAEAGQRDG